MRQLPARRMARVVLGLAVLAALAFGLHRLFLFLGRDPQAGRFEFHLLFQDVQGLRRGSRLVCRGMTLGEVADLSLDPGAGLVRVLCRVDREARELVRTTTRAWVVRPRLALDRRGVSGLDTLVKESYLRLLPPAGG